MPAQKRKDRINEICNEVGYRRDLMIRPSQLSMGEQKLIGFARALICQPDLLFLDEWIESLDENAAHRLISLVQRHQKEQKTVIFVSHDFRIVRSLADYVIMITEGKFVLCASREQMENDENVAEFIERGIAS
jgi:ABC-type multidrug transport system ATPase subunit